LAGVRSLAPRSWTVDSRGAKLVLFGASEIGRVHVMPSRLSPLVLGADGPHLAFDRRLQMSVRYLLKSANRWTRQGLKYLRWCARRWVQWTTKASVFVVFALLVPFLDRGVIRSWRTNGFRRFRNSIALAVAVYVRLLFDRSTPIVGKGLLALAIVYAVAPRDLIPDFSFPIGLIDDVIVVAVASRCFIELCPDRLVERHALRAARGWSRAVRRHAAQRRVNA
jgi:uncharacterized membrane protein YkvA (DUF1232 family)